MPVTLGEELRELITAEARHFAAGAGNPAAREAFGRLERAAAGGTVPDDLLPVLGGLLELGLSSGRIRSLYGAREELAAAEIFRKTPRGRELEREVAVANEALACLEGLPVEQLRLAARGPGLYQLTVEAGGRRLVLALEPGGVSVRGLEIAV